MIVYQIKNIQSGKIYIGMSTRSGDARWKEHLWESRRSNPTLVVDQAIRKYGEDKFCFEILETYSQSTSVRVLEKRERLLIKKFKTFDNSKGYNRSLGSRSNAGHKRPTKARLSARKRGVVPVYQYSLDGELLRSFPSLAEAERKTGVARASICSTLKGRLTQAGGFQWKDGTKAARISISPRRRETSHNARTVYCFTKTGKFMGSHVSMAAAAKATRTSAAVLGRVVSTMKGTAGGFVWSTNRHLSKAQLRKFICPKRSNQPTRKVSIFDAKGRLIKTCTSIGAAARFAEISRATASAACRKGTGRVKTTKLGICRFRFAQKHLTRTEPLERLSGGRDPVRVTAYDAQGQIKGVFPSQEDAARRTKIHRSSISLASTGQRRSAGGYRWLRDTQEQSTPERIDPLEDAVVCQYSFYGKLVAIFDTTLAAGKALGITDTSIARAVKGKAYSADGFFWRLFPREDVPRRIPTPPPLRGL